MGQTFSISSGYRNPDGGDIGCRREWREAGD
jgi:hypothetical protein